MKMMKQITFFLLLLISMLVIVDQSAEACMNPPPPIPECEKPECDKPGGVLIWVIDNLNCNTKKATVRLKNLTAMGGGNGHTCTCALGSSNNVFNNVESINFYYAGTNFLVTQFTNWLPDNTNTWGIDGSFGSANNIISFTSHLTSDLPDNAAIDIEIVLGLDANMTCNEANVKALLADIKLGVDEWDVASNQPAGNIGAGHPAVVSVEEICKCPSHYEGVERNEMIKLRDALQLDPVIFSSWYSNKPLSEWKGVEAVGDCYVLSISLSNYGIDGMLPPTLALPHLMELNLSFNQIDGAVPDYVLDCLYIFNLQSNCLDDLPVAFTGLPSLGYLMIQDNQLDFSDLETVVEYYIATGSPYVFVYSPQKQIPIGYNANCGTLTVDAGGKVAENTYTWFKNNVQIFQIEGVNEYYVNDIGDYRCEVTNSTVVGLTLRTPTYNVNTFSVNFSKIKWFNLEGFSILPNTPAGTQTLTNVLKKKHFIFDVDLEIIEETNNNLCNDSYPCSGDNLGRLFINQTNATDVLRFKSNATHQYAIELAVVDQYEIISIFSESVISGQSHSGMESVVVQSNGLPATIGTAYYNGLEGISVQGAGYGPNNSATVTIITDPATDLIIRYQGTDPNQTKFGDFKIGKMQCGGVTLFKNCDFKKKRTRYGVGGYRLNVGRGGIKNDQLSSLWVPQGYKATLYEHNYEKIWPGEGQSIVFTGNDRCLIDDGFNDETSSVIIEAITYSNALDCISETPVLGCTDPDADNYDPSATVDDYSCHILGCTNPNASNYNPAATSDDGSCDSAGCTDPNADNYNPQATNDNGSCVYCDIVTVYEHCYITRNDPGTQASFPVGQHVLGASFPDDMLSSLKFLIPGYKVTLFENADFTGNSIVVAGGECFYNQANHTFNDLASSLIVEPITSGSTFRADNPTQPDKEFTTTNVNEINAIKLDSHELSVVPNPNNGQFSIRFNNDKEGEMQLKVYNLNMELVYELSKYAPSGNYQERIDFKEKLSSGIYFLQVITDGQYLNKKIIVNR